MFLKTTPRMAISGFFLLPVMRFIRMKNFFFTLILFCSFLLINNSLKAQTITTTESRCVNTGTAIISGTVGAGGPYQVSITTAPADYVNTGVQEVANLPVEFDALYPGSYTIKVLDQNGIAFTYPFTIAGNYVLPGNADYNPTATAVTNCASPNGSIQGILTNGRAPYNYTIISGPARVGTTNSTGTFTGLPAGDYQVQAGDSCQNLQTRDVTIAGASSNFIISNPIINRVSCDSFVLSSLTTSPVFPSGGHYEIVDYGRSEDIRKIYTGTTLPLGFSTWLPDDIQAGYVQIFVYDACGDSVAIYPGTVANDWSLSDVAVDYSCANGFTVDNLVTTGDITAPYTVTVTPFNANLSDGQAYVYGTPQTITSFPYIVQGYPATTNGLGLDITVTDACGRKDSIIKDMAFRVDASSETFAGCSATNIQLEYTGWATQPITYTISNGTYTASNTTGTFNNIPDGTYTFVGVDACGRVSHHRPNLTDTTISHVWNVFTWGSGTAMSCTVGDVGVNLNIPVRAMGPITYSLYAGGLPVATGATPIATQIASNNATPSPNPGNGTGTYVAFDGLVPGTYSVIAVDACGRADTASFTDPTGHAPITHTTTVKNKCINKGDIYATFNDDQTIITVNVSNINTPGTVISSVSTQLESATDALVASDLPVGTYIVQYSPLYCAAAFAVYDTVTITPYVQPSVLTAQSFVPCSGGGSPVIVTGTGGVGPFMYQIINSTPSGYSDAAQTSPVFTLPTSQSTVTVRVLDACLNSTTKTVAITKAAPPIIRSTNLSLSTCTLPLNFSLYVDSLYDGSVFSWTKLTGANAGTTVLSASPSLPLSYNSIADTGSYQVTVTVPGTCFNVSSVFDLNAVTITCSPVLSGTVFDDANGLIDNTVNGTGTNAGGTLNAILVNSSNTVVATTGVNADGTYNFLNVPAGIYSIILSTTSGTAGNTPPAASLPNNWVNTGENLGTGVGNDGTVNGILPNIAVSTTQITGADFGIDQLPIANTTNDTTQVNPGGSVKVQVPALTGSDAEDGTYDGISDINTVIINTLPINGTLYYNGVVVAANDTIINYNPSLLTVDPDNGNVTISFSYSEADAAGKASTPATVTMPFITLTLSGNVYDDANGLTDNTINGTGTNANGKLYAQLVNSSNAVIATVPVAGNGTYSFSSLIPGTYSIILDTLPAASTVADLPVNWVNTGENLGAGAGSDGNPNGILPNIILSSGNLSNADFGIDQLPNSDNKMASYPVNTPGVKYAVPGLTGSDPEDGTLGNGNTYIITTLPSGTILYYNGTPVTTDQTITDFNSSLLTIAPSVTTLTTTFTYASVDTAGEQDPTPATVTISWTGLLPVTLVDFTAQKENDDVVLNWSTATELNTQSFNIERSDDNGKTWETIGEVLAKGNSAATETYSFTDNSPLNGTNLYRLQEQDNNGSLTYSEIKQIYINTEVSMNVYPNPVNEEEALNIQLAGLTQGSYKITLVSSSGQIIKELPLQMTNNSSVTLVIPTAGMARGTYMITINGNNLQLTKTVIVAER